MSTTGFCVFEYLYRDAGDFKAWGALLLKGALTEVQAEENDLVNCAPWGTANALFTAISGIARWNERLSPHWEVASW